MNVRLAAQVLSFSVSSALEKFGPPEAACTAQYCNMFDSFFDCFYVRDKREMKPFLKQYETIDDERFSWLMNSFLPYLDSWIYSIESRSDGQFSPSQKSKMYISWQTDEAVRITIFSIIDLIKYLLSNGVSYVFTQDPLENYFGQQRAMGRRRDNPNVRTFGYRYNKYNSVIKSFQTKCRKLQR